MIVKILFILPLLFYQQVNGKSIIQIKDSASEYITPRFMEILEDSRKEWTFEQVSSKAFNTKFKQNSEELPVNRNTGTAYWGRVTFNNQSTVISDWVIEFPDQRMDFIELYLPDSKGKYIKYTCGDKMVFSNRTYNHKNCVFKIPKNKNQLQTYYFRVEAENVGTFTNWIRSENHFKKYALNEYLAFGLFYGIIVIMIALNFSLYIYLRDPAYIYYVLYVISIGLFSLFQNGVGFQYIWSDFPELNNNGRSFGIFSLVIWQLMYTRSFLKTQKYAPLVSKLIVYFIIIRVLIFVVGYFFSEPLFLFLPIDNVPLLLSFLAGILSYRNGFKPARFFLLGFSMLFFGFVVHSLTNIGLIPNSILTVYAHDIGGSLEMLFLSLAFADKLKIEKSNKEIAQLKALGELRYNAELKDIIFKQLKENDEMNDKVNKELEAKVEERTEEIKSTNFKLVEQANEISRINTVLESYNLSLKANVVEVEKERVTQKELKSDNFSATYPDESACYRYLYELKWGNSFHCTKCTSLNGVEGVELFSMRCAECNYVESVTAHTLFHRSKFSIHKAFQILFIITTSKNELTLDEMVTLTGTKRTTCYGFKQKIKERIAYLKSIHKKGEISWKQIILNDE